MAPLPSTLSDHLFLWTPVRLRTALRHVILTHILILMLADTHRGLVRGPAVFLVLPKANSVNLYNNLTLSSTAIITLQSGHLRQRGRLSCRKYEQGGPVFLSREVAEIGFEQRQSGPANPILTAVWHCLSMCRGMDKEVGYFTHQDKQVIVYPFRYYWDH